MAHRCIICGYAIGAADPKFDGPCPEDQERAANCWVAREISELYAAHLRAGTPDDLADLTRPLGYQQLMDS